MCTYGNQETEKQLQFRQLRVGMFKDAKGRNITENPRVGGSIPSLGTILECAIAKSIG
jgi:hypothetical protein